MGAPKLRLVDTRRGFTSSAAAYCMPLAEMPVATYSRHQAQRLRAELIRDGLCLPTTYVSRVVLEDGTPVWRIAEPWLV